MAHPARISPKLPVGTLKLISPLQLGKSLEKQRLHKVITVYFFRSMMIVYIKHKDLIYVYNMFTIYWIHVKTTCFIAEIRNIPQIVNAFWVQEMHHSSRNDGNSFVFWNHCFLASTHVMHICQLVRLWQVSTLPLCPARVMFSEAVLLRNPGLKDH